MMNKQRLPHIITVVSFVVFIVLGLACASSAPSVPVTYTAPGKLDMSGISKIAIDSNSAYVTNELTRRLTATGKYTIATAAELTAWKQSAPQRKQDEQLLAFQKTAIEISAAALGKAYSDNSAKADLSYSYDQIGKPLKISGVIKEIGNSSKGVYYARLDAGKDSVDVYFAPNQQSIIASLNKGRTISLFGKCKGYKRPDTDDTAEILKILGKGQSVNIVDVTFPVELKNYTGPVDAVISITSNISLQDTSRVVKEIRNVGTDAEGKAILREVSVRYNDRTGVLNINYQIARTRDGSVIGQGTKSATSPKYTDQGGSTIPSSSEIESRIIDKPLVELAGEMVPVEQTVNVPLAKEEKNKEAKKEMSEAEKLIVNKSGVKNYIAAAEAYGNIYAKYKNFAAGYNQAVLTEGTAGTATAIKLMEALVIQHPDENLALTTLSEMRQRNEANQQARQQQLAK